MAFNEICGEGLEEILFQSSNVSGINGCARRGIGVMSFIYEFILVSVFLDTIGVLLIIVFC